MTRKAAALTLLLGGSLLGAEFRTGQAARAVLGQSSFGSREAGITATSLVAAGDRLYAADRSQRTYTFDLSPLVAFENGSLATSNGCPACVATPIAQSAHAVMPGVAAVSVWSKTVAVADPANHRVLIWRDATAPKLDRGPDLVLEGASDVGAGATALVDPVSVALDGRHLFVGDAALHRVLVWNALPVSDNQPADEVLGQPDFVSTALAETPAADSVGIPAAMVSNGSDLFVADNAANRILVFSPADMPLGREKVTNAASLTAGPIAPGTLVTISGDAFSKDNVAVPEDADAPLPRKLAGVEVILDGVALPLLAVSPDQVEALVPPDLNSRTAASLYVRMEHDGLAKTTEAIALKMVPASPGLFASGGNEPRPGLLLHGTQSAPVTSEYPAHPGEVLTAWATGLGAVLEGGVVAAPIAAQIDGQNVSVLSAKLAEHAPGVYEVRIVLPAGERSRTSAYLGLTQNGLASNDVSFPLISRR